MDKTAEQAISPDVIEGAMDYAEYRQMINELLEQGKTTGPNQSEKMTKYTEMNVQRMNRLDKQVALSDSLREKLDNINDQWIWLVLTEAWCGDAAQNVPVIAKMADQNPNIDLNFILRDQNIDIMDEYLTNGGRSIPKLICLDTETLEEVGTWGPRPETAQKKAMEWKDDPDISKKQWAENLHKWYADNRAREIQEEFEELLTKWSSY